MEGGAYGYDRSKHLVNSYLIDGLAAAFEAVFDTFVTHDTELTDNPVGKAAIKALGQNPVTKNIVTAATFYKAVQGAVKRLGEKQQSRKTALKEAGILWTNGKEAMRWKAQAEVDARIAIVGIHKTDSVWLDLFFRVPAEKRDVQREFDAMLTNFFTTTPPTYVAPQFTAAQKQAIINETTRYRLDSKETQVAWGLDKDENVDNIELAYAIGLQLERPIDDFFLLTREQMVERARIVWDVELENEVLPIPELDEPHHAIAKTLREWVSVVPSNFNLLFQMMEYLCQKQKLPVPSLREYYFGDELWNESQPTAVWLSVPQTQAVSALIKKWADTFPPSMHLAPRFLSVNASLKASGQPQITLAQYGQFAGLSVPSTDKPSVRPPVPSAVKIVNGEYVPTAPPAPPVPAPPAQTQYAQEAVQPVKVQTQEQKDALDARDAQIRAQEVAQQQQAEKLKQAKLVETAATADARQRVAEAAEAQKERDTEAAFLEENKRQYEAALAASEKRALERAAIAKRNAEFQAAAGGTKFWRV